MPRVARMVLPGVPHHVIQRGNRRQPIFFGDGDQLAYLRLLAQSCGRNDTCCLAWCMMDNHVHLILTPASTDGLRATLASTHTAFSQRINRQHGLDGHLFQGRYRSYPMDDAHLFVAARYIENNPVAAGLVSRAEDWHWSSARAHIEGRPDGLTDISALGAHVPNWRALLARGLEAADEPDRVELALRTGRPMGSAAWLERLGVSQPRPRGRPKMGTVPI